MKELVIVVPLKKAGKLSKVLEDEGVKRFFKSKSGKEAKFTISVTDLQSKSLINELRDELGIHAGKPSSQGYISVSDVEVIAPHVTDKGSLMELDRLIMNDVKEFIRPDRNFVLFIIGAAVLASFGFILDNIAIIIGAMIIGPFMPSLIASAYGIATANKSIILKSLRTELITVVLILSFSFMAFSLFSNPGLGFEKSLARADLLIVLVSSLLLGLIASASFLTGKFEIQAGIAISISLIPPLVNFAGLLLYQELISALNALYSFLINFFGMKLAAIIAFLYFKRAE